MMALSGAVLIFRRAPRIKARYSNARLAEPSVACVRCPVAKEFFFVFPIGVLTSNKEGKVICEIEGRVLGGMQFGVLVQVLRRVWAHICKIQGRVLGCMQFGVLVQVLRTVRVHICKIQGRVLGCMQFGVLV